MFYMHKTLHMHKSLIRLITVTILAFLIETICIKCIAWGKCGKGLICVQNPHMMQMSH